MITYFMDHRDMLLGAFFEHLWLVCETLFLSIVLASILSYILLEYPKASPTVIQVFGAIYSIPSLALFALLIPFFGLGNATAIPVLVAYNQYLLIRNFMTGLTGVDASLVEAAVGMGMNRRQVVTKVRIPLAMPAILSGIRLSIISTTGIATIAATINAGGLGKILLSGLRTMNEEKIAWGTILCVVIALAADLLLKRFERENTLLLSGAGK